MFKAMLMVCALSTPGECVRFDDNRGPYPDEARCQERSREMATQIVQLFPVPATYAFKCEEVTST